MPILSDDLLEVVEEMISEEEYSGFRRDFLVKEIFNRCGRPHTVSVSLFCKPYNKDEQDIPPLDEEFLRNPASYGVNLRFNPWDHYVEPLLTFGRKLMNENPDIGIRVYLANDLDFLVERLADFCEVRLMSSSSSRSAPGMLWRFLALEEFDESLTIIDSDSFETALPKICLSKKLLDTEIGFWRIPAARDFYRGMVSYRPISGCFWGTKVSVDVEDLMIKYRYLLEADLIKTETHLPSRPHQTYPILGCSWPNYGADEFFLMAAIYPRLAKSGCLTVSPPRPKSEFFSLDVEYVTWSSRHSCLDYSFFWPLANQSMAQREREKNAGPMLSVGPNKNTNTYVKSQST